MKIMSVDYGDARTGVAFCDENEILASPYKVIYTDYTVKLVNALIEIINKEKPKKIVIGLPVNMDGSYGFRAEKCRYLGDLINEKCDIEIDYEDERLTTVIAHDILSANNVRGKKRKDAVDAVSATVILQSYIDRNNK
ncbi:MAG: Holliday junction resolvase RuvX [Clostridiales bacterium]|nr:Holliday junction resolvase RuvX [Clostridiales bacterium]